MTWVVFATNFLVYATVAASSNYISLSDYHPFEDMTSHTVSDPCSTITYAFGSCFLSRCPFEVVYFTFGVAVTTTASRNASDMLIIFWRAQSFKLQSHSPHLYLKTSFFQWNYWKLSPFFRYWPKNFHWTGGLLLFLRLNFFNLFYSLPFARTNILAQTLQACLKALSHLVVG